MNDKTTASVEIRYLACPECSEDAIPQDGLMCSECGDGETMGHDEEDCTGTLEASWWEGEHACPACKALLRVVVDDAHAYVEVRDA